VNLDAIAPGDAEVASLVVDWPEGSLIGIEAVVVHRGERTVSQATFQVVVPEAESTFNVPWAGLGLGMAGGLVLLGVEAIRRRAPESSSTPRPASSGKASESKPSSTGPVEKIEVACPACDRTLRVPGDYSGAVRCPDCRERFDVEAEAPTSPPEENPVEAPSEASEKVEIGCPACSRALRVPSDFNGRVRCPACKHEFSRAEAR